MNLGEVTRRKMFFYHRAPFVGFRDTKRQDIGFFGLVIVKRWMRSEHANKAQILRASRYRN